MVQDSEPTILGVKYYQILSYENISTKADASFATLLKNGFGLHEWFRVGGEGGGGREVRRNGQWIMDI